MRRPRESDGSVPGRSQGLKPLLGVLGLVMMAGIALFSAYNLYSAVAAGVVYRSSRVGDEAWIAYADHPLGFAIMTSLYALFLGLPTLAVVLIALDQAKEARIRRRLVSEALSGEASRPVVRGLDQR